MQQLPHQHDADVRDLQYESSGGQRQPVRHLPQRILYRRGRRRRARHRVISQSCRDQRPRLHYCHANSTASYTTWAGGKYTHAASDTNCSTCHNGTAATGMTTPPHIPSGARPMRQLPRQHGDELCHLHDESRRGQREPLRFLSQRIFHGGRNRGCTGDVVISRPRRHQRTGLHHLPHQFVAGLHHFCRRVLRALAERYQLLQLPQRYDGDREVDSPCSGRHGPVQQLSYEYGAQLRDLYDEITRQ